MDSRLSPPTNDQLTHPAALARAAGLFVDPYEYRFSSLQREFALDRADEPLLRRDVLLDTLSRSFKVFGRAQPTFPNRRISSPLGKFPVPRSQFSELVRLFLVHLALRPLHSAYRHSPGVCSFGNYLATRPRADLVHPHVGSAENAAFRPTKRWLFASRPPFQEPIDPSSSLGRSMQTSWDGQR